MGYRNIAVSSSNNKKDFAFQLGATDYTDTSGESAAEALQKMDSASLIAVTAPNPKIIWPLVEGLGPLGKLLVLAPVGGHTCKYRHALDGEEAIDFAEKQGVKCMIEKFPFDRVEDSVQHMESGNVRFRSVIVLE
ncbi:hypothetical protein G6011_04930 [Alternaria panax]|uniref:Alcohol dehydrogenase-like C-terminal domain-containing protein n=1 Tax=Alternaria panax TaxID=48097 RepID=A0AAD4IHT2_9PLEO|nr:hypothetical protein G6011_04930 [Alternaria panax]